MPIVSFVFMLQLWRTRERDPARMPIAPQYEPLEGMTPAEIGTLIDNSPDMRDITASMVDLAVRGCIKIEEHERTGFMAMFKGNSYSFRLLKELDAWSELQPHERSISNGLFNGGYRKTVDLDDPCNPRLTAWVPRAWARSDNKRRGVVVLLRRRGETQDQPRNRHVPNTMCAATLRVSRLRWHGLISVVGASRTTAFGGGARYGYAFAAPTHAVARVPRI